MKLVAGDGETFTELFNRCPAGEELGKDTKNEEQPITGIGNDQIRKDSVGMPTAADQTEDADIMADRLPLNEINDPASVISMNAAVTSGTTNGTGFQFRTERAHIRIK